MEFPEFKKIVETEEVPRMLPHETSAMREELRLFMIEHPAQAPLRVRLADRFDAAFSFGDTQYSIARPFATAMVLVLCVGVGTSYAAEGALPGDSLYPIKIHVNESVQGALALSSDAKASWNTERASRRLEEAETLVAVGKLTPLASATIQAELQKTAADFNTDIAEVAPTGANAARIAGARSDFEATLTAHTEVLADLARSIPSAGPNIEPILANAAAQMHGAVEARVQAERAMATDNSDDIRSAALDKKIAAEGSVRDSHTTPAGNTSAPVRAATAFAPVSNVASGKGVRTASDRDAEATIRQGVQNLDDGQFGKAFASFQAAIRSADVERIKATARERLQVVIDGDKGADSGQQQNGEAVSSGYGSAFSATSSASSGVDVKIDLRD